MKWLSDLWPLRPDTPMTSRLQTYGLESLSPEQESCLQASSKFQTTRISQS